MCRLYVRSELSRMRTSELHALFNAVSEKLIQSDRDTLRRRNALASLDNISAEIARRYAPRL